MKKIKNISLTSVIVIFFLAAAVVVSAQERNWDGQKTKAETSIWQGEIKNWQSLADEWVEKRDRLHETYYGDDYVEDREFCNEMGCWKQKTWTKYIFTGQGGEEKWEIDQDRTDAEVIYENGKTLYNGNDGQSIEFYGSNKEMWDSSNFGQVLTYINISGDKWKSSNFGQVVEYEGVNGEKWESSNYGQVIEHWDADGNYWRGSENDLERLK